MPRKPRNTPAGLIYHVYNRAAGKSVMLRNDEDFATLQRILVEAVQRQPLPILGYCLMGNRWHMVVQPKREGQMSDFFRWLTLTHAVRWRVAHHNLGHGHLYRGRFKAFAVQRSPAMLDVLRFVEGMPLAAGLVKRAEDWPWSSLWARKHGPAELRESLADWPVPRPNDWLRQVNRPLASEQLMRLETSQNRERPYGDDAWVLRTVAKLGLEHTIRGRGRPSGKLDPAGR